VNGRPSATGRPTRSGSSAHSPGAQGPRPTPTCPVRQTIRPTLCHFGLPKVYQSRSGSSLRYETVATSPGSMRPSFQ
jgi:hypothetical protein